MEIAEIILQTLIEKIVFITKLMHFNKNVYFLMSAIRKQLFCETFKGSRQKFLYELIYFIFVKRVNNVVMGFWLDRSAQPKTFVNIIGID